MEAVAGFPCQNVRPEEWDQILVSLSKNENRFFIQGETSPHFQLLEKMKEDGDPYQTFFLSQDSRYFFYQDFLSPESKEKALATLDFHIDRFSLLARKKDRAILALEELLLNASLSAPQAARDEKVSVTASRCRVRIEWDASNFWIHVIDPYGAFRRKNFERSFRPAGSAVAPTSHGHSGRGLQITFENLDDLWIKSRPGWGTIVSGRIAMGPGKSLSKTFLADFE